MHFGERKGTAEIRVSVLEVPSNLRDLVSLSSGQNMAGNVMAAKGRLFFHVHITPNKEN